MLLDFETFEAKRLEKAARAKRDTMNPMRWELLTDAHKDVWRAYRQALLDVPPARRVPYEHQLAGGT